MNRYGLAAVGALLCSLSAHSEVLRYKLGNAPLRPYLFVDDSLLEAAPRDQKLPSQLRLFRNKIPSDPRDYLLRDKINDGSIHKTSEEIISQVIVPAFTKILRADLGTTEAPVTVLRNTIQAVSKRLRESLSQLESELVGSAGPRHIVWLIAPWEKSQGADRARERFAPGQLGFSVASQTPTRNFAAKHWLLDIDQKPISAGYNGELEQRVQTWSEWSSSFVLQDSCSEAPHATPPYVYPSALLVHLKLTPGGSTLEVQLLVGLHPMIQALEPTASDGAEIRHAGVPQPMAIAKDANSLLYPMMLATYKQPLKDPGRTIKLHFDFGTFGGYSPLTRALSISNDADGEGWRMAPFLGGDFILGSTISTLTHLRIPVRVHLKSFDVVADTAGLKLSMAGLATGVELDDCKKNRLGLSTGLNIGIGKGGATEGAAAKLQLKINEKIEAAFAEARAKTRAEAMKKFPLAVLFMDGAL